MTNVTYGTAPSRNKPYAVFWTPACAGVTSPFLLVPTLRVGTAQRAHHALKRMALNTSRVKNTRVIPAKAGIQNRASHELTADAVHILDPR